jgi:hypothetical protein
MAPTLKDVTGALGGLPFDQLPDQAQAPAKKKLRKVKDARGDLWFDGKFYYLDELGAGKAFETQEEAEAAAQEVAAKKKGENGGV